MSSTRVPMGYIKGAFGVRGRVRVAAGTEYTDGLLDYPQWHLLRENEELTVTLAEGGVDNKGLWARFEGVEDRDKAHALRGFTITIDRSEFAPTDDDEYYWADLIGLKVVNREGEVLGTVSRLMETGAHDVLVISGNEEQEILVPFVSQYIDEVSVSSQTIRADWQADY